MLEQPRTKMIMVLTVVGAQRPWEGTGIHVCASAGSLVPVCSETALNYSCWTEDPSRPLSLSWCSGRHRCRGAVAGMCGWVVQRTVSPANNRVIQHAFSKNCNQQAVQEHNCEALEAVTRLWYKCTVVGCTRVDHHQSATKNTFTKWKAAATFVPQPKDNSHANAKAHWQVLPVPNAQRQTKMLKKKSHFGLCTAEQRFSKGKD